MLMSVNADWADNRTVPAPLQQRMLVCEVLYSLEIKFIASQKTRIYNSLDTENLDE